MKKILVVDDEEHLRELFKEELEDEGYEVILANSGEEAIKKLNSFIPDLITLDLKMPGMGGIETLKEIKKIKQDLPVVIFTGYGKFKQNNNTWDSDAYVVKSSDLLELKSTIKKILKETKK